jgi:hypothetical protein
MKNKLKSADGNICPHKIQDSKKERKDSKKMKTQPT